MATSIYFTESKDFKLIKSQILSQEEIYLVYVYADTKNIRIPKELIRELPVYGNNLIWVDTADMDFSDMSHHMVLTIGQYLNQEEEISFFIVSRSSRMDKTVLFLRNQGIPVEIITLSAKPLIEISTEKKSRKGRKAKPATSSSTDATGKRGRGRPKKEETVPTPSEETKPVTKRGRPKKAQSVVNEDDMAPPPAKKRGRPKKEEVQPPKPKGKRGRKPSAEKKQKVAKIKKSKEPKEVKPRKTRVEKEITSEEVTSKLALYPTSDPNLELVLTNLFQLKKVSRPKFESKLVAMIQGITLEGDMVAEQVIGQLKELGVLEDTGKGGRLIYRD